MPGQPSPTSSNSSLGDEFGETCNGTRSSSSLDSLGGESCDDPADSLHVPDAVVAVQVQPSTGKEGSSSQESTDGPNEQSDPFEEAPQSSSGGEDEIGEKWNPSLYMLQSQAPKPVCVPCKSQRLSLTEYGVGYHGVIDKHKATEAIGTENGAYLIRATPKGAKILSFRLDDRLYNFRLYFEDGQHFVGEKHFDSIEDLVQDGLITLYLQKHDVAKVMEEGRNKTMVRREQSRRLRRQDGRRVRGLKGKAAWRYSRSASASSTGSMDVQPPSLGNSPSPSLSRSPSPIPVLNNDSSPVHNGSARNSLSPAHHSLVLDRNKSLSPEGFNLILDLTEAGSRSAPQTPLVGDDRLVLIPPTPPEEGCYDCTSLDLPGAKQRRSTPDLAIHHTRPAAMKKSASLGERRAKSSSALQKGSLTHSLSQKERRTAIFSTLRTAIHEDEKNRPELKKSATLGSSNKPGYVPACQRSSFSVANTLHRVADYSVKGPSSLSRSSLAALAKHTSGPKSPYTKAHNFEMHTYKAPTWCEICHNFLWGLTQQGMECKDCGMDIHKQCLPLAIQLQCFPTKTFVKRVYGVDLTTLVKLEGGLVPKIVNECISNLESRGLTSVGIYRVSGHSSEILELKDKYDQGENVDFSSYNDENIVTGAIKLYLRELPIPLITFDAYKNIIKATAAIHDPDNEDTDWQPLFSALLLLPKAHYNTLKHLARHLHRVDSLSDENKMSARNLAVVFAPTLMRSPSDTEDHVLLKDLPLRKTFVEYLITYHQTLFKS